MHSGGRGSYYTAQIRYQSSIYSVSITSDTYRNIANGIYPDLYYVPDSDKVISQWSSKKYFRLTLLGLAFMIITFTPRHWFKS